jgi:hypothetical protein
MRSWANGVLSQQGPTCPNTRPLSFPARDRSICNQDAVTTASPDRELSQQRCGRACTASRDISGKTDRAYAATGGRQCRTFTFIRLQTETSNIPRLSGRGARSSSFAFGMFKTYFSPVQALSETAHRCSTVDIMHIIRAKRGRPVRPDNDLEVARGNPAKPLFRN